MLLQYLLENLEDKEIIGDSKVKINKIEYDSKKIEKGDLFVAINGLKVLIQNQTDFSKNKNIIVASSMLVLGLGGAVINFKTGGSMIVPLSGMSLAAVVGILVNLFLPEEKE